jgi:hypothetical protein
MRGSDSNRERHYSDHPRADRHGSVLRGEPGRPPGTTRAAAVSFGGAALTPPAAPVRRDPRVQRGGRARACESSPQGVAGCPRRRLVRVVRERWQPTNHRGSWKSTAPMRGSVPSLSRNFGHQAALTAGLDHTDGDVIVTMDVTSSIAGDAASCSTHGARVRRRSPARSAPSAFSLEACRHAARILVHSTCRGICIIPHASDYRLMDGGVGSA